MSSPLRLPRQDDWDRSLGELDAAGSAVVPGLLAPGACRALSDLYDRDGLFRKRVDMERHGFGRGQYAYFAYPLPGIVQTLREALYPPLAALANDWSRRLGLEAAWPATHAGCLAVSRAAGQSRPTPLLLRYRAGDYNCLHQDLYGPCVFPIQATVLLSRPGDDFTGGEFVLTEQRPRRQSRAEVAPLGQGDAVLFAVRDRPVRGARGDYRVTMRHGVSRLRSGERCTLGVIFHDAA